MMILDFSKFNGKKIHDLKGGDRKDFVNAVAAFMREPMTPEFSHENSMRIQAWLTAKGIQAWTDKADFPSGESFYPLVSPINALPVYDEGWREVFKVLDYTGSAKGGFRQLLLTNGITFEQVPSGGKANIFNVTGSKVYTEFDKWGAGLEWDKTLFEDAEWVQIADVLSMFRNAAYQCLAQEHYDLLTYVWDAANPNIKAEIAWQNPLPAALANTDAAYIANRDVQTINLACQTIALACRNKGYGITPQSTFLVLTPLQLRGRIRMALGLALQAFNGSPLHLDYNIRQITTMMLRTPSTLASITDHFIVAFPGARLQAGMRMNLEELTEENILARSTTQVDWLRFGSVVGDYDQLEMCNIA